MGSVGETHALVVGLGSTAPDTNMCKLARLWGAPALTPLKREADFPLVMTLVKLFLELGGELPELLKVFVWLMLEPG